MKFCIINRRVFALAAAAALVAALPVSAAVRNNETIESTAAVTVFSKNGSIANEIRFSANDFQVVSNKETVLDSIILTSLPTREAGSLMLGDELLIPGDVITVSALNGIHFRPLSSSQVSNTSFTFTPVFTSGEYGAEVAVNLYLLDEKNGAPIAENLEFTTYKNVVYTGRLSAVDPEGDLITFQLVDKPARGSLTFSTENEAEFVYSPYENKTGKDSFTYVAIDAVGNKSEEATVKIQIKKPSTKVTYADMDGHPACNAAIHLAEKNIFVGSSMNGTYYFQPDLPLTRVEFLAMTMNTVGMNVSDGVTVTGFYDDAAIQTWAKPYIAFALKSGSVQGNISEDGHVVFRGNDAITRAEAAVLLNRMLSISDVSAEIWGGNATAVPTWACQAVMNLESTGILHAATENGAHLSETVTRADAAQMLSSALNLIDERKDGQTWFQW